MHMASFLKNNYVVRKFYQLRLHPKKQLQFLQRLHRLLNNGYPLIEALNMMKLDSDMEDYATTIKTNLIKGLPIDQAFEKARFDSTITSYLYFVRMNGDLETSLKKCINMFEQRLTNLNKFLRVIRYPIILMLIFVILLILIKQTIMPTFLDLFATHDEASSTVVYFILVIDFLSLLFIIMSILFLIFTFLWQVVKKRFTIEKQLQLYNRIPFLKSFLTIQTTFFFATHMSMLLKTGMPIKDILRNMAEQTKLPIIAYYSKLMKEELTNGNHYITLLKQLPFLEKQFANLFQKNNDKQQLERDLSSYATMLAEKIEQQIMKIITIIQPVFFIVLGCFIILVYGTLMWPMLQLIKSI